MPTPPKGDVAKLLESLGRSSTPPVKKNAFGLDFGNFLGPAMFPSSPNASLVIGTPALFDAWPSDNEAICGVPGLIAEQAANTQFSRLIIDAEAFYTGPWMGADSGGQRHLAEEIFEAGRIFRATGRSVFYLSCPVHGPEFDNAYIRSTSTVDLGDVPEVDLEEGAPQSSLWDYLRAVVDARYGSK